MNENKFTPRAEEALRLSQEAAGDLGHGYVGTEHLLLGLIREGEGMAHTVLTEAGLTDEGWLAAHADGWEELRATLEPWSPEETQCLIGQTPDAIRELALAYGRAKAPCIVLGSGFSRLRFPIIGSIHP